MAPYRARHISTAHGSACTETAHRIRALAHPRHKHIALASEPLFGATQVRPQGPIRVSQTAANLTCLGQAGEAPRFATARYSTAITWRSREARKARPISASTGGSTWVVVLAATSRARQRVGRRTWFSNQRGPAFPGAPTTRKARCPVRPRAWRRVRLRVENSGAAPTRVHTIPKGALIMVISTRFSISTDAYEEKND